MKLMKRSFFLHENILPEIYRFYPSNLAHFVTLVYPHNVSDDDLSEYMVASDSVVFSHSQSLIVFVLFIADTRKYVHSKFNLPCDVPLFRRNNAFRFTEKKNPLQQLLNVHEGLAPSGGKFLVLFVAEELIKNLY